MVKSYLRNAKGQFVSPKSIPTPSKTKTTTPKSSISKIHTPKPLRNAKGQFISNKSQPTIPKSKTLIPKPSKTKTPIPKPSKSKTPIQKPKIDKSITSTSKTTREYIQTTTQKIKILKQNFTFDLKPRINTKAFNTKIPYLLSRILSQYRKFQFKPEYVVNIRSNTIFSDRNHDEVNVGHNTGNHKCRNILILESVIKLLFDLIKNTAIESEFWIEFIDLTISIYLR